MANKVPKFDDRSIREQSRKISSISSAVKDLQKSNIRRVSGARDVSRLISTTTKVVQKLGGVAGAMATGIKNTTIGATKYTKDAIKQYGQALQEDIQLDVGRLQVLTTTGGPIFGYFINRFMKTPGFQSAIGSIRDKISETMSTAGVKFKNLVSSGARNIRDSVGSIFGKIGSVFGKLIGRKPREIKRKTAKPETTRHGVFVEKGGEILYYPTGRKRIKTKIPQLQRGGVVGEGGLARLHPAEIVMPIEQLLAQQEKNRIQVQKSFITGFQRVRDEGYKFYERPFYEKWLDVLFDIKVALTKSPSRFRLKMNEMWEGFLNKHPVFTNMLRFSSIFYRTLTLPIRILFSRFGGKYRRMVSRDPNPLISTASTIGAFYPVMTWKQDQMIELLTWQLEANRDVASALTGKRYGPISLVKFGRESIIGVMGRQFKKLAISLKPVASYIGSLAVKAGKKTIEKVTGRKLRERKTELHPRVRTTFEILTDIQSKMLYRLDLIARRLIPQEIYQKAMEKEYNQIVKIVGLTDAELGIERKRLSLSERLRKGIINVGEKLESSKVVFRRIGEFGKKTLDRTIRAINIERKQNETLDKVVNSVIKVKDQVKRTGQIQASKISEQIRTQKKQIKVSKLISEKFSKLRNTFKRAREAITKKLASFALTMFGLFKKIFSPKGMLIVGLSVLFYQGIKKLLGTEFMTKLGKEISKLPLMEKITIVIKKIGREISDTLSEGLYDILKKMPIIGKFMTPPETAARRAQKDVKMKSELRLVNALKGRVKRGKMTQRVFNLVTEAGPMGVTDSLIRLRNAGNIVDVGGVTMTKEEKFGLTGAKAYTMGKIGEAEAMIKEKAFGPIVSKAELAGIAAMEKAEELKARLEADKKVERGLEEVRKFQGVVVNNFNRASNMISNSVSSAVNGIQDRRLDFGLDSIIQDVIKGDLE